MTLLNTIMADALNKTVGELEERLGEGKSLEAATHDVMVIFFFFFGFVFVCFVCLFCFIILIYLQHNQQNHKL